MVVTPAQGNSELFVNVGPQGTPSPLQVQLSNGQMVAAEFLLLVNGRDDAKNGLIDSGWNGRDDDGINGVDDIGEWVVQEQW